MLFQLGLAGLPLAGIPWLHWFWVYRVAQLLAAENATYIQNYYAGGP
jgi:hypothetical protein